MAYSTNGIDDVIFVPERTVEGKLKELIREESSASKIEEFLSIVATDEASKEATLNELYQFESDTVCGKYKRIENGDSGEGT